MSLVGSASKEMFDIISDHREGTNHDLHGLHFIGYKIVRIQIAVRAQPSLLTYLDNFSVPLKNFLACAEYLMVFRDDYERVLDIVHMK